MKMLCLLLLSLASCYGAELTYISNDTGIKNLESLENKYKQALLINEARVYLITKECQLKRYFGAASEGELKLVQIPRHTETILITQEVFEAKDEKEIQEKIETEKSISLIEGRVAKAFLEDKEGRGFGGFSEIALDFKSQKIQASQSITLPKTEHIIKETKEDKTPNCHLLKDGSGYRLENISNAQMYSAKGFSPILDNVILFN